MVWQEIQICFALTAYPQILDLKTQQDIRSVHDFKVNKGLSPPDSPNNFQIRNILFTLKAFDLLTLLSP